MLPTIPESPHPCIYHDEIVTFWMETDPHSGRNFIHINVREWSKEKYYRILNTWWDIQDQYGTIYAGVANDKIAHFCSMLGFELTDEVLPYTDGVYRRTMICPGQ